MKSKSYTDIRKSVIVHNLHLKTFLFPFFFHQSLHPKSFQSECFCYLYILSSYIYISIRTTSNKVRMREMFHVKHGVMLCPLENCLDRPWAWDTTAGTCLDDQPKKIAKKKALKT